MPEQWSKEEDEIICEFYCRGGYKAVAGKLEGRSRQAITSRAYRLGVKGRHWTPREDKIIKICYPDYGAYCCQRYMPYRSISAIQTRARIIKVKRDRRAQRLLRDYVYTADPMAAHRILNGRWR